MANIFRKTLRKKLSEVIGDYSMAGSRRNDAPGNIRSGTFVISSRTNVLTDEEAEESALQKIARVIVRRKDGKFLCIYDPKDPDSASLPGGHVEPGELVEDGALRELWEETGLIADDLHLVSVDEFMDKEISLFVVNSYDGVLKSSDEGELGWCSATSLISGSFGEYYKKVFEKLGYL